MLIDRVVIIFYMANERGIRMLNKWTKYYIMLSSVTIIVLILCGCSLHFGQSISSSKGKISATFANALTRHSDQKIDLKNGETITFFYDINIKSGTFSGNFKDSSGNKLFVFEPDKEGTKEIIIDQDDVYEVEIECEEAKGSYRIQWKIK